MKTIKSPTGRILAVVGGYLLVRHIVGRNIERGFRQTHETSIDVRVGDYRIQVLKPLPGEKGSYEWIVDPADRFNRPPGAPDPGPASYGSALTEEEAYAAAANWIETHG